MDINNTLENRLRTELDKLSKEDQLYTINKLQIAVGRYIFVDDEGQNYKPELLQVWMPLSDYLSKEMDRIQGKKNYFKKNGQ